MRAQSWLFGAIVGLLESLIAAVPTTLADWRLNPSGIFRNDQGTDWIIVAETALSWYWPVALVALVATVIVHFWIFRDRQKLSAKLAAATWRLWMDQSMVISHSLLSTATARVNLAQIHSGRQ